MTIIRTIWTLLKTTFDEWRADHATRLAAALSYYTAISIAPLLVLVLTGVSFFYDTATVRHQLADQIRYIVGPQGAQVLLAVLNNAEQSREAGLAGVLGMLTLLWGASNVFAQLQNALNVMWDVELKPSADFWVTVRRRFLSFAMVLVIGFLLLVSLVISTAIAVVNNHFSQLLPGTDWIWQLTNLVISLAIVTLLFGLIYKVLPDAKIAWRDVWWGAAVTAILFAAGKYLLGLYLGMQTTGSAYGAAGSLVVLLIWVYFSAQIFFFGAEFTQVQARRFGRGLEPTDDAQFIDKGQAQQR